MYFVDCTVLVSSSKNLLVELGMGFTIDWPENPLWISSSPWLVQLMGQLPCNHCSCNCLNYNALNSPLAELAD